MNGKCQYLLIEAISENLSAYADVQQSIRSRFLEKHRVVLKAKIGAFGCDNLSHRSNHTDRLFSTKIDMLTAGFLAT